MPQLKDADAFADSVVLAIKSALSPISERLAAAEARLSPLADLRDRVVVCEAKAAVRPPEADINALVPRITALETKELPRSREDEILERLAVAEQANRDLQARVVELSALRDRLTTIEVKSAIPAPVVPPVDLSPLQQQIDAIDRKLTTVDADLAADVSGLRGQISAIETKAAVPVPVPAPVDIGPIQQQIKALESRLDFTEGIRISEVAALGERVSAVETKSVAPEPATVDLGPTLERLAALDTRLSGLEDVRDRIVAVETKAALPVQAPADVLERIAAVETRLTAAELRAELKAAEVAPVVASLADLTKDVGTMRERVAVMEVRAQVPGPAGKDGADGQNGKDGQDGLGFDDLSVDFDEDRTVSLKFQRGDRVKTFPIKFPIMRQQGVYIEGKQYTRGDVATWAGSSWHCETDTTTKPGEGSKAWTLIVKRGRDGKDGRDGRDPVPVVRP